MDNGSCFVNTNNAGLFYAVNRNILQRALHRATHRAPETPRPMAGWGAGAAGVGKVVLTLQTGIRRQGRGNLSRAH